MNTHDDFVEMWETYHLDHLELTNEEKQTLKDSALSTEGTMHVDDRINPQHYKNHPSGIECITITEHMSFLRGNAMKYLWRADHKNGLEDLKKALWYLQREIANMEAQMITNPKT